jgi:putative oxidoreductase
MMDQSAAWVYLLIRVLSCGVWLFAGLFKLTHFNETVADMKEHRLPMARYLLPVVLAIELIGSVFLVANIQVSTVVLIWIAFIIPATMLYHWPIRVEGVIVFPQLVQFSKNLTILGGLVALLLLDPTKPAWLSALVTS